VAGYSKETIEQVLQATDIVGLVQGYLPLKRAGSQFRANCPFHNEKTPSFYVNPARQSFHCFGCGKGGDAISFVREYENLPFAEAIQKLAQRAGIPLIEETPDPEADRARRSRGRLLDLMRETCEFLHGRLMNDPAAQHARDYLKSRGYGREMAEGWRIGWMPDSLETYLSFARQRKFSGRELVDSGMAYLRDEENPAAGIRVRFRDRLMFPIRNEVGDVIAFSGRQLREDPNSGKYVNSPETILFRKSRVLFALDRAKKPILTEKSAVLCEGQIDVIACHEAGLNHVIAPLGTAFTKDHARLLRRYTPHVTVCYDADNAGLAAAERAFRELAAEGLAVRVARMPKGEDPDSFLKSNGPDALRGLIQGADGFFDFKLGRAAELGNLDDAARRATTLTDCAGLLALMSDFAARENEINVVSTRLKTSAATLRQEIAKLMKKPTRQDSRNDDEPGDDVVEPTKLHRVVEVLCQLALGSAAAQHFLCEQFETIHEASRWLEGIALLETILSAAPDPATPAAVNAFLGRLAEADRLALQRGAGEAVANGLEAAEESLGLLSSIVLHKRDAAVKAELKEPGLDAARMIELLEESKEISGLMRGLRQRAEFDDELPPSTFKPKEPAWKTRWKSRQEG